MRHGDGPDETRRFPGPGGGSGPDDRTRRVEDPDATRRVDGPGGTRRMHESADPGAPVLGGRYRLEGMLGSGGMAEVHRATDVRLNRPVAVKIFRPGTDPEGERRFHEEAHLLANLNHPGLVAVHDSGVDSGRLYLVMELVDGQSLRGVLDRQRPPLDEVARIGTDVADILTYVHSQDVVHRDVKPSNVLIAADGRVRLADFGISRLVGATGMTAADSRIGTAAYMAPEQVRGDQVGPPADVYALGLVLLEAVTGRAEYPGQSWEAAAARLSTPPAVPQELPEPLHNTLLAMTETEPQRRPTAAQAADMLAEPAEPPAPEPAGYWAQEQPARRSRAGRNLALTLGVFVLAVVIAALAYAGIAEQDSSTAQPDTTGSTGEQPGDQPAGNGGSTGGSGGSQGSGGDQSGGDGGADGPNPPDIDPPDLPDVNLPDLPDINVPDLPNPPEVGNEAKNLWQRFTDWVAGWF